MRRNSGGAGAQQFAAGDDVGAGAELCQGRDHGLVGIRLHGVADQRVDVGKGAGEHGVVPLQGRARIAIERRADGFRQRDEIDPFGVQHAVAIGEMVHGTCLARDCDVRYGPKRRLSRALKNYCRIGSRMNDFFVLGAATGLPRESKPFFAAAASSCCCVVGAPA